MFTRRGVLAGALAAASLGGGTATAGPATPQALADLERRHGGRLGVAILGAAAAAPIAHRGDERFALCSTHKFLSASFVLARVERGEDSLTRRIPYQRDALVPYSPITENHVGEGLTLGELCEAAITLSDNTAANLLLDSFGGPAALTAWLRSIGDAVTRLDRREPALNDVPPGDARDTTTPLAMAETMRRCVLGPVLSAASREQLVAWMVATKTGDKRIRAGVPPGWRIGDKTGSGKRDETNDIAVIWPPGRAPIIVACYYAEARGTDDERSAVLAEVGRLAAAG